jgi:uncharacterized protein with von Willebrand factor type A (vWA) domain
MEKVQAFQTASLSEGIVAFAQFARGHGLNIGIRETQDAIIAAGTGLLQERRFFKAALKSIFCNTPEEMLVFEKLFALYWDTNPIDLNGRKGKSTIQGSFNKKANASVVMLGIGQSGPQEEEAKNVSGANAAERLKKTDLSLLNTMEAEELADIARKLCKQMAVRMRRRMKQDLKAGQINLRRTIRKSLSTGSAWRR